MLTVIAVTGRYRFEFGGLSWDHFQLCLLCHSSTTCSSLFHGRMTKVDGRVSRICRAIVWDASGDVAGGREVARALVGEIGGGISGEVSLDFAGHYGAKKSKYVHFCNRQVMCVAAREKFAIFLLCFVALTFYKPRSPFQIFI